MKTLSISAAAAAALVLAAGCAGNGIDDEDDDDGFPVGAVVVPSTRVTYEQFSGIETRQRRVIRSEAEWTAFWSELYANQTPRPSRPAIDFDEEIIIVAATGERPTGGYSIAINNVYRAPGGLVAVVTETSPAQGCVLTQAVTAPVYVTRVPITGEQVRFVERENVRQCE